MSRKVGQSPGSCPHVQPNTGHCRGFSCTDSRSPLATDVSSPASAAALAALLAALLFFFPFGTVVVVAFGGPSLCCRKAGTSEHLSAAAPSELGVVGRAILLADGGPSGSVESVRWLSLPSSDITSRPVWGLPTVLTAEVVAPGGSPPAIAAVASRTLFPSANLTIRSSCISLRGYAVTALIPVWATHTQ
jgi:hypothetical protein